MKISQELYQQVVFYCNGVYKNLAYPDAIKMIHRTTKLSGLRAEVFETQDYDIVVFSGTDFASVRDWLANIKMALGIKPMQFTDALELVLRGYNPDKTTIICGHSLGGAIAEYCVASIANSKVIGVTFNGAGIQHICRPKYPEQVYHFITKRDILNRIMKWMPFNYFKHVGEIIMVEDKQWNGIKSHSNFHAFMKHKFATVELSEEETTEHV